MNLVKTILGIEDDHNLKKKLEQYKHDFIIQFTNCRLMRDNKLVNDDLWIRNGVILDPEKIFFEEKKQSNLQIDCNNLIISPGLIDAQLNGGFGYDFTSDFDVEEVSTSEKLQKVSQKVLQYGVTAYCPTIVSSGADVYAKVLPFITKSQGGLDKGATILGAHLEGPFISKEKYGAHQVSQLKTLDKGIENVQEVYGQALTNIKIITLAPELDPTGQVIEYLTKQGIVVSIGHTQSNLEQGECAVKHGCRFITHLFNAMAPFHHRDPHLFGLLSDHNLNKQLYYGIIADGIHTHPSALNIAYKTHPDGLVLVTDAVSAMGLPEGKVHHIGKQKVEIRILENNKKEAVIYQTNTLCGSIATLNECVRIFQQAAKCSLAEALRCASEHPAKMLNLYPCKGSLKYGSDADFIIIDDDVNVYSTFINGDLVWSSENWTPLFKFKSFLH